MEEDKTPTKALYLKVQAIKRNRNTARRKYTVQLNSRGGLIDGASVKPSVIG